MKRRNGGVKVETAVDGLFSLSVTQIRGRSHTSSHTAIIIIVPQVRNEYGHTALRSEYAPFVCTSYHTYHGIFGVFYTSDLCVTVRITFRPRGAT